LGRGETHLRNALEGVQRARYYSSVTEYPFALFGAFSEASFGGCLAGIIDQASDLSVDQMLQIAQEIGAPATGFITDLDQDGVSVRFFSTLTEYPMCGHVTIGLMTWLTERGWFVPEIGESSKTQLRTPDANSEVEIRLREDGRPEISLTLAPAVFEAAVVNTFELTQMLDLPPGSFRDDLDMTVTTTDFRSLLVPIRNTADLKSANPNFAAITDWCQREHMDTVFLFASITANAADGIRVREFCPAVGTLESAASGTTNRAVSCYLYQANQLGDIRNGDLVLHSEQGNDLGRPSLITSRLSISQGQVAAVCVGGVATKIIEGSFLLS
jgi:trans-2,3-dihydro-3-hydroxyanthranilate isomerase